MKYGRDHEDIAVCGFLNAAPATVGDIYIAESPFFPHTDPTLGASPDGTYAIINDGKVAEQGVIEIKCPGKTKRPYPHWKFYYVPQTYWEMSCSGHKNVIAISWGPKNMRAWRYSWDDRYWNILSNLVEGFRNFVPYEKFVELQSDLIEASHEVVKNAEDLHPGKGWKQNFVPKVEPPKHGRALNSFKKDLMWARVTFLPGTEWYKAMKPKGTFMVVKTSGGYELKNRQKTTVLKLNGDERIVKKVDYYE